jgi:hypothetical protein
MAGAKRMIYETFAARNYDLDLAIAESRGISVDDLDALPLETVERLRKKMVSESPDQWEISTCAEEKQ